MNGWQRREFGRGSSLTIGKFVKLDTTDQRDRGCGWVFHVSAEGINGGDTVTQHGAYDTEDDAKRAAENWIRDFCTTALAAIGDSDTQPDLRRANLARQQEWDPNDQITLAYRGNELAGEVGEACNVIKKIERERLGINGSRDTVAHLAEELADVVICADLIAMHEGIDLLGTAVPAKFNATSEKVGLKTRLHPIGQPNQMPAPDAMVQDPSGEEIAAMFYYAAADQDLGDIAEEQGFDCLAITAENEISEDDPLFARLESLELLATEWTPAPREGWQLALKFDGEEGPTALFIRRKSTEAVASEPQRVPA